MESTLTMPVSTCPRPSSPSAEEFSSQANVPGHFSRKCISLFRALLKMKYQKKKRKHLWRLESRSWPRAPIWYVYLLVTKYVISDIHTMIFVGLHSRGY